MGLWRSRIGGWRGRATVLRDLAGLRALISERLAELDRTAAVQRLWRFLELFRPMRSRMRARSDDLAAVDGDFIITAEEVQPVLHALRKAGIHIVALHNHMVGEQPAFFFTHFWGKGKAADLAGSVRAALDVQAKAGRTGKGH